MNTNINNLNSVTSNLENNLTLYPETVRDSLQNVNINDIDIVKLITAILLKNKSIDVHISKHMIDIFEILISSNLPFLNKISSDVSVILNDHKIDISDIPILIQLITDIANFFRNDLHKQKLTQSDILLFIGEILIIIINEEPFFENKALGIKLVNSSIPLLITTLHLNKTVKCKWWCF